MSLLTDTDIRRIMCNDVDWPDKSRLHIHPFDEVCLTPVGYDLRVGWQYASAMDAQVHSLKLGEFIDVRPGDTVLISTLEDVGMPAKSSNLSTHNLESVQGIPRPCPTFRRTLIQTGKASS